MSILVKKTLHTSVAESIFREIGTRGSKYFFFLGKPAGETTDSVNSFSDELKTRADIILFQEIKPSDACLVVPRIDWKYNEIYDKYDDNLSTELAGINLKSGGVGYSSTPNVIITGGGPNASGASAVATIDEMGRVVDVTLTSKGIGYTQPPTVAFQGAPLAADGVAAVAIGVINKSESGATRLEDAKFYVITDDYNVYKCLNNNYGARSLVKPKGTSEKPIKLSDGYVWRFMYAIPAYLRNKFLTFDYMPVVNSLNDNFYSNGEIGNVGIINSGTGYTWAKIRVDGDGYSEKNPYLINNIFLNSGGSNYQSPTLSFQPPFVADVEWNSGFNVLVGEIVSYDERYYRVVVEGELSDSEDEDGNANGFPIHRSGTERNGNALLEFVGETTRGVLDVENGVITSASLLGRVLDIQLDAGGIGYTSTPSITIITGKLWIASRYYTKNEKVFWKNNSYIVTQAGVAGTIPPTHTTGEQDNGSIKLLKISNGSSTAYAQTLLGTVTSIKVLNQGDNYSESPSVVVGNLWYPDTAYSAGQQVFYADNLYTVTQSGISGTSFPAHTSGEINNSSAGTPTSEALLLTYAGKSAKARSRLHYGYGYKFLPQVSIEASQGLGGSVTITGQNSSATFTPIVINGSIVSVIIDDPGIGYTYTNLYVEGDGTGAVLRVDLTSGDVNSVQGNSQLLGEDGTIHHIQLLSGGYGYTQDTLPTIDIIGDGTGAVATPYLNPEEGGDKLLKIEINNSGKNYRWADVKIIGGSGKGAKARAVIAPYLGHGKDAVTELFATRLMFYSVFSGESLFGFDIENEYRQVGIIKNPRRFADRSFVGGGTHTPCVIVSANAPIDTTKFYDDMEIRSVVTGKKYRIVAIEGNMLLLENLQNAIPVPDEEMDNQLTGSNLGKITVESVVPPTIDKYSGDLLYIENRQPFRPTELENVALRSVVAF